jgi:hypothetical protein
MLTSGVAFLYDNAQHTAAHIRPLLEHFNWKLFDHPSYIPHLAESRCKLFTCLKNWLRSQSFNDDENLMEGVKTCLSSQVAIFVDWGIKKLIPQ